MSDLWIREAQLVDVSFPQRQIDLIVMPYDEPALVPWDDRTVEETIARGAFDGIERRPNRVNVNRDHDRERTIGRALTFHPDRREGLVANLKISRTRDGDEALELAADGCLDASAGFRPMDGGLRWDGPNAYTITKAWLGHIALVPEPAYDGARVLAVRHQAAAVSATPNLDQWRAMLADDRIASLTD
jgi:HK97 family phage prohead protease